MEYTQNTHVKTRKSTIPGAVISFQDSKKITGRPFSFPNFLITFENP